MIAYCDYISHLISTNIKAHDSQGLLWQVGRPNYDLDSSGALSSTTKTLGITDINGKRYRVTVEEIRQPVEELVDGTSEALKAITIRGD